MHLDSRLATSGATTRDETRVFDTDALSQTAEKNLAVATALRSTAWSLAEAGLRTFRPELSEAEVQDEVRALFRRTTG